MAEIRPADLQPMKREQDVSAKMFLRKKFRDVSEIFHAETSRIIFVLFLVFYKLVRSSL